ncbi:CAP domain-containing protein [Strongyloides ratti]|uniref:CAP domain-containing protein n=1 Tax=Strongyloides ratti TaxID=34506 RepID=A0A090LA29_STRRB|nr:CAP domain-containing protein [Strongyloides ratti]CEF66626.1 CAP domain-containing protein [Strongyloides ratti]
MRLIYYLFFIVYYFTCSNLVTSRLTDIKIKDKGSVKIYIVNKKAYLTSGASNDNKVKKTKIFPLRKSTIRPIRRTTSGPTKKPMRITTKKPLFGKTTTKKRPIITTRKQTQTPKKTTRRQTQAPIKTTRGPTQTPKITSPSHTKVPTVTPKHDPNAILKNHLLEEINNYRARHQVPKLMVSDELEKAAQKHAEKMAEAGREEPDTDMTYGGNVISLIKLPETAVKHWYHTIINYDFAQKEINHLNIEFVNLVWKSTTHIGCGVAKEKSLSIIFISCKFNPKADTLNLDKIEQNVLEPK